MKGVRKILIAVNGSSEVLRQGLRLACDEKTWVTVVKVLPVYDGDLNLTGVKNIGDMLDSDASEIISRINGTAKEEGAFVKIRVEEGDIPKMITEVAEEERCDLIIMGANKTGWVKRLLGLNIVEKVIAQAPCPVLLVGREAVPASDSIVNRQPVFSFKTVGTRG